MNSLIYLDETSILVNKILKDSNKIITKLVHHNKTVEEQLDTIPEYTKRLKFGYEIKDIPFLDFLPEGIEELVLGEETNHTLNNILNFPKNIKKLKLGGNFNQKITTNIFPKGLTCLHFGTLFNQEITSNIFPDTLRRLIFGFYFNHEINKNLLPKNLEYLNLGVRYDFKIKKDTLPEKLKTLRVPYYYSYPLEPEFFPETLETIIIYYVSKKFLVGKSFPKHIKILEYHSTSTSDIIDFE